jgi:hypothetical protein
MWKAIKHMFMWMFSSTSTVFNSADLAADQLLIAAAQARNESLQEAGIGLDELNALKNRKPFVG